MRRINFGVIIFFSQILLYSCSSTPREDNGFLADWESMERFEVPGWFHDAKFGIYFHWGIYSVPAFETEWYSRRMYEYGSSVNNFHTANFGPVNEFGYKDFIPMFKPGKFDADEWAGLFRASGAKFAGLVAEHADGFAMWDSDLTRFDAMDMGPMRDVVGEMERAVRSQGLKFITSFQHQRLYGWYPTWDESSGTAEPAYRDLYGPVVPRTVWKTTGEDPDPMPNAAFCDRWKSRVVEVIDKYNPDLIAFDSKLHIIDEQYRLNMLSHYYNRARELGKEVVVTYKNSDLKAGTAVLDMERSRMQTKKEFVWLTDDSVDWGTWCNVQRPDYKSADYIIDFLVDVVSKNGCVLLNVTPTAEGEIPAPVCERLLEIGRWLEINGEAIYGTRPWKVCSEGPAVVGEDILDEHEKPDHTAVDIRFTCKGNALYAICLGVPDSNVVHVRSLLHENDFHTELIDKIIMLGSDQEVLWEETTEGLKLRFDHRPDLQHAVAFRIEFNPGD